MLEGVRFTFLVPVRSTLDGEQLLFDTRADSHGVVHVGCFLEFAGADERRFAFGWLWVVFWPSDPSDPVLFVVLSSRLRICFRKQLHTVVVDEDVGGTALHLVGSNRRFERLHRRVDDGVEALLVNRTLNGHVR